MATYYVLPANGYPDTRTDYVHVTGKAGVFAELSDLGYLDNPGVSVYSSDREPWTEIDPYPDFIAERGPRGGYRWERA